MTSLDIISDLGTVIGMLERKWPRPHSEGETAVMQTLLNIRETVRKAHEEKQEESKEA